MNLSFRKKIFIVVAPALLVVLLIGAVLVRLTLRDSDLAHADVRSATAAHAAMILLDEVQDEGRHAVRMVVASDGSVRGEFEDHARRTDAAHEGLVGLLARMPSSPQSERVIRMLGDDLPALRRAVLVADAPSAAARKDAAEVTLAEVARVYDGLSGDLSTLAVVLTGSARSTRLNARSNEVVALLTFQEAYNRQLLELQRRLGGSPVGINDAAAYDAAVEAADRSYERLVAVARPKTITALDHLVNEARATVTAAGDSYLAAAAAGRVPSITAASWIAAGDEAMSGVHRLQGDLSDEFRSVAQEVERTAHRRAAGYLALCVAAFAAAALAAYVVGRSLSRRLSGVTQSARAIAVERLPAMLDTQSGASAEVISEAMPQIVVAGHDEVAQLADDFNRVLRLAVETSVEHSQRQAAILHSQRQASALTQLLVSLGRRNQALIDRQLELVDQLEAEQTDERTLAGLFRLDHMITRQRRSAESLLVLAGSRRTRTWTDSLPISQVLRGAISEVAQMERVSLEILATDDLVLLGTHAVDLAHLLAELIENAIAYSNPATNVLVRAERDANQLRLLIVDAGVGMTAEQMTVAHLRLASPVDSVDMEIDQVGFQVVGRLAQLIGVGVQLEAGPAGGLVVIVAVPMGLFEVGADGLHPRRRRSNRLALDAPSAGQAIAPAWPMPVVDLGWAEAEFTSTMGDESLAFNAGRHLEGHTVGGMAGGAAAVARPVEIAMPGLVVVPPVGGNTAGGSAHAPLARRDTRRRQPEPSDGESSTQPDQRDTPAIRPLLPTARSQATDARTRLERRRGLGRFTEAVDQGRESGDPR